MTYNLDSNKTQTLQELFETIAKIVGHPHKNLTSHDSARAAAIMLVVGDYLGNLTESDNNGGYYVPESNLTDFEGFVMEMFDIENYGEASADELLKK